MAEAKLAPNLPQWMIDHANRYISSGGSEGHIYTVTPPGYSEMHVPSLLLTTAGRKSGEKFIFPLFYGDDGRQLHRQSHLKVARLSTRAGIGTSSPIPRSRFRSGRKRSRPRPGRPAARSANGYGKRH